MDNSKDQGSKIANSEVNPSNNTETLVDSSVLPVVGEENGNPNRPSAVPRTPFTNLSQVDADLALARTLQDQVYLFYFDFSYKLFVFLPWFKLGVGWEYEIQGSEP